MNTDESKRINSANQNQNQKGRNNNTNNVSPLRKAESIETDSKKNVYANALIENNEAQRVEFLKSKIKDLEGKLYTKGTNIITNKDNSINNDIKDNRDIKNKSKKIFK